MTFKTCMMEEIRNAINICTMCGFCKSVCPSFKVIGWDSALSRGRIILSYGLLNREISADDSVVESMYTCTTCADCVRRCPSKVKIVDIIENCRADLVKNGHILSKHETICKNILNTNNPYGEKKSVVDMLKIDPKKSDIGYFAGCTATYRNKNTSKAAISILKKLDVEFTIVNEVCCGSIMQRIGWPIEDIKKYMQKNVNNIKDFDVKTLIFSCAGCYRMFKNEYPKYVDVPFEVLHITEFLAKQDLKLKRMDDIVTYHDPCHLGRHTGVFDAPRDVIKKIPGVEFREMEFNRDFSHCCGGGGGVRSAYPDESKKIACDRIDEITNIGVNTVITACPFCVNNLTLGCNDRNIKVVDLTEVIDYLL